jgi:hypothetical protein
MILSGLVVILGSIRGPMKMRREKERAFYLNEYIVYRQEDPAVPLIRPHCDYPPFWVLHRDNETWLTANKDSKGKPYAPQ